MVRRAEEEKELLREKEFSSLSPDAALRGGRMEEGLGREERFSGLLVTPSWCWGRGNKRTLGSWEPLFLMIQGDCIALAIFPPVLLDSFL